MNQQRKALERCPTRAQIHEDENHREEQMRDYALSDNNLDALHLHGNLNAATIFADFVRERKAKQSMIDRFDLLTADEKYAGIVRAVELGVTTSDETIEDLDLLKTSYTELLQTLKTRAVTDGEINRENARRTFEVRQTPSTKEYIVVARNRLLALGRVATNGASLDFAITKRMVFELPTGMHMALANDDFLIEQDDTKERYELQIDANHKNIYPIRTAYTTTTQPTDEFLAESHQ